MAPAQTVVQKATNSAQVLTNSVSVAFPSAQTADNLNLVAVAWDDTASTVTSVTDTNGNTYLLAAGTNATTTLLGPGVSQAIYYAKKISGGANTVTVQFNQNVAAEDIRIVEYSGLDTTQPLDVAVGSFGNASSGGPQPNSGQATTTSANDVLIGAGTGRGTLSNNDPNFTPVLTNFGDVLADRVVNAVGTYSATAVTPGGLWVMQMVALRAAGQSPSLLPAPTVTSVTSGSSSSGPDFGRTSITVTGTNFAFGATVIFDNGTVSASAVNCSVASATTITCLAPAFPVGTANVTVMNVDGQSFTLNSAFTFAISTPVVSSVTPNPGGTNGATIITISGSEFADNAAVLIGNTPADNITVVNFNTIMCNLPAGQSGPADVFVHNPNSGTKLVSGFYNYTTGVGINFLQRNSAQPGSSASVPVTYLRAQAAGDLNVVVIGWKDTTTKVNTVTDKAGNTYSPALPLVSGNGFSQMIWYAKSIAAAAAGSNTVTVNFNGTATSPDVRILEYSGIDPLSPLEPSVSGNSGTGTTADSGAITVKANDLVIAAATVDLTVTAAGSGFTTVMVTAGDNVEHQLMSAAQTITPSAELSQSQNWVMQAVAFKKSAASPDFSVSVSPSSQTVARSNSASYTVTVTPSNGFTGTVSLSCAGLPAGASCAFNPPSVTPGSVPVNSTLTLKAGSGTPLTTSNVTINAAAINQTHTASAAVTVTDFSLSVSPSSQSVSPGGSGSYTVSVSGQNGFNSSVILACSGLPAGASCSFNPASLSSGGSSTLTVTTTGSSAALVPPLRDQKVSPLFALWLPLPAMALAGAGLTRRRKLGMLLFLVLALSLLLAGCGGGGSSSGGSSATPAGTYNIGITATSGQLQHSTQVSLTVQ